MVVIVLVTAAAVRIAAVGVAAVKVAAASPLITANLTVASLPWSLGLVWPRAQAHVVHKSAGQMQVTADAPSTFSAN